MDLSTIWYPSYGYLGDRGSSSATTTSAPTRSLRRLCRRRSACAGGRAGPQDPRRRLRERAGTSFSVAWQQSATARAAGWLAVAHERPVHALLEPDGRVYFAGDHLSYYIAWQAGAIDSARKVVMDFTTGWWRHDRSHHRFWPRPSSLVFAGGVVASGRLAPGWDFSQGPAAQDSPPTGPTRRSTTSTSGARPVHRQRRRVGDDVELYYSSGIGPGALNTAAPGGTPERYIDPAQLPGRRR